MTARKAEIVRRFAAALAEVDDEHDDWELSRWLFNFVTRLTAITPLRPRSNLAPWGYGLVDRMVSHRFYDAQGKAQYTTAPSSTLHIMTEAGVAMCGVRSAAPFDEAAATPGYRRVCHKCQRAREDLRGEDGRPVPTEVHDPGERLYMGENWAEGFRDAGAIDLCGECGADWNCEHKLVEAGFSGVTERDGSVRRLR